MQPTTLQNFKEGFINKEKPNNISYNQRHKKHKNKG